MNMVCLLILWEVQPTSYTRHLAIPYHVSRCSRIIYLILMFQCRFIPKGGRWQGKVCRNAGGMGSSQKNAHGLFHSEPNFAPTMILWVTVMILMVNFCSLLLSQAIHIVFLMERTKTLLLDTQTVAYMVLVLKKDPYGSPVVGREVRTAWKTDSRTQFVNCELVRDSVALCGCPWILGCGVLSTEVFFICMGCWL